MKRGKYLNILKKIGIKKLEASKKFLEENKDNYGDWYKTVQENIELLKDEIAKED